MTNNLESGFLWAENRIRELSAELDRPVDCLEWPQPTDARYGQMMMAGVVPLKIWRGGAVVVGTAVRGERLSEKSRLSNVLTL